MANDFQTLAVNQLAATGYGADYPFAKAPPEWKYMFGDLWFSYPDDACELELPLRIGAISDALIPGNLNLEIRDAAGTTVFNTAAATRTSNAWGKNLVTYSYKQGEFSLRLTQRLQPPPWEPDLQWPAGGVLGEEGTLDARTYQRLPKRVRSIVVGLTTFTGSDLRLVEGYNMSLTTPPVANADGGRRVSRVMLRARPGDGLGRPDGCDDAEIAIQRINTVPPTKGGDFVVDTEGCYRIQRPVTVTGTAPRTVAVAVPAALQIFNDCGPCCPCDDFVRTYEGIRRLFYRYQTMGEKAEATRDTFLDNIERWELQRACRELQTAKLVLQAERGGILFVGGVHCNMTKCCSVPLLLRTTFEYFQNGSPAGVQPTELKCKETKRSGTDTNYDEVDYQPVQNWPVIDHPFGLADPMAQSRFRTRLKFPAGGADSVRVTFSVHMPDIFEAVSGDRCALPVVEPPAEVAAIWASKPPPFPARAIVQKVSPVSMTAGCGACP